jgi:YHS domain-containing protein
MEKNANSTHEPGKRLMQITGLAAAGLILLQPATQHCNLQFAIANLQCLCVGPIADPPRPPKEALQSFNDLIGSWKGTGTPEGTKQQKQAGFWTENISWSWQFDKEDAWLTVAFGQGKYFKNGTLRYVPEKDIFRLAVMTVDKHTVVFEGSLKDRVLTVERLDETTKESQRLIFRLIHDNRFLYDYETKPDGKPVFTRRYQVGATKEGVAFATGGGGPECIVTGGRGTMMVSYKGQTYYVCCSGCRDAFNEDPEKFIKEYEAKKNKKP